MRKIISSILFVGIFQFAAAQQIPSVKIGQLKQFIDTSKSPLVISFWASWCAPCIQEITWFEKAVEQHKAKGVKLILVSLDFKEDYPKSLPAFVKKKGYKSSVLWLNETDADVFCSVIDPSWEGAIPVTLMVNNQKKYRKFYGTQIPERQFEEALKKLLD